MGVETEPEVSEGLGGRVQGMAGIKAVAIWLTVRLSLAAVWFWSAWHVVAHTLGLPCPW